MSTAERKFRISALLVCMNGLLSDPTGYPEEKRAGETCAQATARLAAERAEALTREAKKRKWIS